MKKLLLAASLSIPALSFAQEYSRAKILAGSEGLQQITGLGVAVDHGTVKRETYFISDFSSEEIQTVRDAGFTVEILIPDVVAFYRQRNLDQTAPKRNTTCEASGSDNPYADPAVPSNFNLGTMGGFYTYEEFLAEIDAMSAQYPNLITAKAPIGSFTSIEGRPIYYLRMSDNPNTDEPEPEVLYSSNHHAREPNALSETIFYMWYLLENYASNPEIAYILDNTELYFVPMVNPDGYRYNQVIQPNGGGMWRKNRRQNSGGSYGVDLNRNYSYGWGTTGVSTSQSGETYPGTGPFSEPETQAMKWFCENRDFVYAFNAHTYANDILFPIGTTVNEYAEDHDYFNAFTHHMVEFNGYTAMKSSGLYPASGDSDDYMYKVDLAVKPKIFAMTPEVGSDDDGFWPASADITDICKGMFFPNLTLAHLSHKYLVVKDIDPNTIESTSGYFHHSAYRLGIEDGPVTVSVTPLAGIQTAGAGAVHDPDLMETENDSVAFTLVPGIQFGDEIKYVLNTEYGLWTRRDTIVKTFGAVTTQVFDDAANADNWTGTFGISTAEFYSPSQSFTDSPMGQYANSTTRTYTFAQDVDLTNVTAAGLSFYAKWEIENDYDFCQLQVSVDGGNTWTGQCGSYTNPGSTLDGVQPQGEPIYDGTQQTWVLEEISLSDYIGETIRIRFLLRSDNGVRADGFYFDDFRLMYNQDFTGIGELEMSSARVFPNPASGSVMVSLPVFIESGEISIYNMNGGLAASKTIDSLTNTANIDISGLSGGVYWVKIASAETSLKPVRLVVVK
jgi:carboxypeptidase T